MKFYSLSGRAILVFCVGAVIAVLLPFHIHPLRSFWNDFALITALFLAFFLVTISGQLSWRWTSLSLLPCVLLSVLAIQLFFFRNINRWDLFFPAVYFLILPFAFGLGASLSKSSEQRIHFCVSLSYAFILSSLVSVIIQVMQVAGIRLSPWVMTMPVEGWGIRPYANLGQPNQLALWVTFGLSGVWFLFRKMRISGQVAFFIAGLLVFGLSLTQSRIGWIILPFMYFLFVNNSGGGSRILMCAILLIAEYVFFVFGLPAMLTMLQHENVSGVVGRIGGRSERLGLYSQALGMLWQHPFLGVGWGQFGGQQVVTAINFPSATYSEHAHNILLQLSAEIGMVATAIIFSLLSYWGVKICIAAKKSDSLKFIVGCLAAVLVHSMVEFPLWYGYVLFTVAVLMGIAHSQVWHGDGYCLKPLHSLFIVVLMLSTSAFLIYDLERVVKGFNQLRQEQTGSEHHKALIVQPVFTTLPYYYKYFEMMRIEPTKKMPISEIIFFEHWSSRFGFVHIINKLAEIHVLNNREDEAVKDMITLQRLHPDRYPEYFDYWKSKAYFDSKYAYVVSKMPPRNAP